MLDFIRPITDFLPEVKRPEREPSLKEKLLWTFGALVIFFILGQIFPAGVSISEIQRRGFERLEILLGSKIGSLITAGIGPIVLSSIFLQLATGAGFFKLDLSKPENKRIYQGLQKLLAIILSFLEGIIYVFPMGGGNGYIPILPGFPWMAVAFQLALGSIVLLYLDEVVQKYGIGSGISLFIAAGVSQQIFVGALSPIIEAGSEIPAGLIPQAIYYLLSQQDVQRAFWTIVPLLFTVLVFLVVVYVEGMKIELPLAYGRARGLGARYPIKFLYVSNIPVILASAVILNFQLLGSIMSNAHITFPFGPFLQNQPVCSAAQNLFAIGDVPVCGLSYYLQALPSPLLVGGYQAYLSIIFGNPLVEIPHILIYGIGLVVLCVVFGWFWIESTNMDAASVASQLNKVGLQIPGFRQDPRITEKILDRYIPIITILGSVFVGILAWFADITGALGTGTGILLTVGILYQFYEQLAKQQIFEMYPALNKFVQR